MAEAAIFHLLQTFRPFFQDEFILLSGVREEIVPIRNELERMMAFLEVAEANGEHPQGLQVYVRQVRELSYEAGDVLEQFTLRLHRRNGHGIYGFFRKAYYSAKTLRVRHQLATKVQRIKLSMSNISPENEYYRNLICSTEQGSDFGTIHNSIACPGDALPIEESKIVGIERPRSEILQWFGNGDNHLQLLSVVGMGGLGKTTLVKKVFDDIGNKEIFESCVWITVSEKYKVDKLLKDIIKQLFKGVQSEVLEEVETMDENKLKIKINNLLSARRYLLVLDDVWHSHTWQSLEYAFPNNSHGSRIILTTRIADIAFSACNDCHGKVYNLLHLSEEAAWTLFCLKAFQNKACPSHLKGTIRDILKKCEGLPLAIEAIGSHIPTEQQRSIDEWNLVYRTIKNELEKDGKLHGLQKVLLRSFRDLPYQLKISFLYLSVFPENYSMDHWRLVRLLISEGFVKPKPEMSLEEEAEKYLMELKNRSLILVKKLRVNGTVKAYHIHGIWREIIMSKSMEQNLVSIVGPRQENNQPNKVRRLSIHDGLENWKDIEHFTSQLRSLLIFCSIDEKSALLLLASLRDGARLLQVLDFRGSPLTTLPEITMKLLHLKYLSLRGTKIKEIPKSIGNLQMLETLDLKDTLVDVLPNEITKLQRLRHLLVYRYLHKPFNRPFDDQIGFKAVKKMGSFSCLQKLCSVELNQGILDRATIIDIRKLTKLRRINILKVKAEDGKELCTSLDNLKELRSLSIGATNTDEIINLESLTTPPQFLRTFILKGRLEKLPQWISSLHNVVRVDLRHSKLKEDPLKTLRLLPYLAELLLERAYEGELLAFETDGFQSLKKLVLDSLNKLRQVTVTKGSMPELWKLHIFGCELLDELPSGMKFLSSLKDFRFYRLG